MNRIRAALLLLFVMLSAASGQAQTSITIFSARTDAAAGELIITGSTFPVGSRVFLLLNPTVELQVLSIAPSTVRAKLPQTIPAGTFLLVVFDATTQKVGMFDMTGRVSVGPMAVDDANGTYIGELDTSSQITFKKAGDLPVRLGITRGGFASGQGASTLLHLDPACSSPLVPDPPSLAFSFFDTYALSLPDGTNPTAPGFPNTLWVPDRSKPRFVPSCDPKPPAYLRNTANQCVLTNQLTCGASYRPAKAISLSHFVPPFNLVP